MKTLFILLISLSCLSFCPSTNEPAVENASNGFYISVIDHTDRTHHEFILESKDSVNMIFEKYFQTELSLADLDYPISIFDSKRDFYLARVNVFVKSNGKKGFKHLKYPDVYVKNAKMSKRKPLPEQIFDKKVKIIPSTSEN